MRRLRKDSAVTTFRGGLLDLSRRAFLRSTGLSLGAIALGTLLRESLGAAESRAPQKPHFTPRAKHVIYLHMIGAPSQLDLFEHKPALLRHDGQPCPKELTEGKRFAFLGKELTLA